MHPPRIAQLSSARLAAHQVVCAGGYRNYLRGIRAADTIIYGMIAERRRQHIDVADTDDLLTMLMRARDEETGEAMSDKQLRDEAMTIMVADTSELIVAAQCLGLLVKGVKNGQKLCDRQ